MTDGGLRRWRVDYDQIVRIEAAGHNSKVITNRGEYLEFSLPIGRLEELLPSDVFCRISNSDMINVWHITSTCGRTVNLDNGDSVRTGVTDKYRNVLDECTITIKLVDNGRN